MPTIINTGWLAENALRQFPLAENVTAMTDDGYVLPTSFITDLSVSVHSSHADTLYVSALGLTKSLVSLVLSSINGPVLAGTFLRTSTDTVLTLIPVVTGASGFVVFSDAITIAPDRIFRFSTPEQTRLAPSAVMALYGGGVTSLNRKNNDKALAVTGTAVLGGRSGVTITGVGSDIEFGMLPDDAEMLGNAIRSTQDCGMDPLLTINGVSAAADGSLLIRFL